MFAKHLFLGRVLEKGQGNLLRGIDKCLSPRAIDSESIKPLSVLHSGLKCELQPILTPPKKIKNK